MQKNNRKARFLSKNKKYAKSILYFQVIFLTLQAISEK